MSGSAAPNNPTYNFFEVVAIPRFIYGVSAYLLTGISHAKYFARALPTQLIQGINKKAVSKNIIFIFKIIRGG